MNKNRLEAFSDGVFAIVITLMIFDIKAPIVPINELSSALDSLLPKFLSFILSFVIIGVYWISHHNMLHFIEKTDRVSLWLNLLVLLTICIIPFPTSLVGNYPTAKASVIIYGLTLSSVNMAGTWFWYYCSKNNRLTSSKLNPAFSRKVVYLHSSPVVLYLLAIILSFVSIKVSYAIYVFVPVFFIVPNALLKRLFQNSYID